MARFRLIHLSDLHLATKPNRSPPIDASPNLRDAWSTLKRWSKNPGALSSHDAQAADALAHQLRGSKGRLDAILITGDISATGFEKDLLAARNYLFGQRPFSEKWNITVPALTDVAPFILMPGNHDRFEKWSYAPGRGRFERDDIFGARWRLHPEVKTDLGKPQGPVHSFHFHKDGAVLTICCADFSLKPGELSPAEYLGKGQAYPDVLEELIRVTNLSRSTFRDTAVVWAVHFPPNFAGLESSLVLRNETKLIEGAKTCGVSLLFAGHTHEERSYEVELDGHKLQVLTCGTTLEHNPNRIRSFQVVTLDVTAGNAKPAVASVRSLRFDSTSVPTKFVRVPA